MQTRFIYILTNEGIPTYVGKTKNIKGRAYKHKKNFPNDILEPIDEVPVTEWKFWESHYISLYKSWGFNIRNKKSGGDGSDWISPEIRQKLSLVNKGKIRSKETLLKMSESHKGKNLGNTNGSNSKGYKHTQEWKDKRTGVKRSEETKIKMRISQQKRRHADNK